MMWNLGNNKNNVGLYSNSDYAFNQPIIYSTLGQPPIQQQYRADEPLNWDQVKSLDPNLLRRTGDLTMLQPFITDFVGADFELTRSAFLNHPLTVRLCQILQISLKYMSDVQIQLQHKVKEREDELKNQDQKIKKLVNSYQKANQLLEKKMKNYERCPICRKKYISTEALDKHFAKHHPVYNDAWQVIRLKKPITPPQSPQIQSQIQYFPEGSVIQNTHFSEIKKEKSYEHLYAPGGKKRRKSRQKNIRKISPISSSSSSTAGKVDSDISQLYEIVEKEKGDRKNKKPLEIDLFQTQRDLVEAENKLDELEQTIHEDLLSTLEQAASDLNQSLIAWNIQQQNLPPKPQPRVEYPPVYQSNNIFSRANESTLNNINQQYTNLPNDHNVPQVTINYPQHMVNQRQHNYQQNNKKQMITPSDHEYAHDSSSVPDFSAFQKNVSSKQSNSIREFERQKEELEKQRIKNQQQLLEQKKEFEHQKIIEQQKILEQKKILDQQKKELEQMKIIEERQRELDYQKKLHENQKIAHRKIEEERRHDENSRLEEMRRVQEQRMTVRQDQTKEVFPKQVNQKQFDQGEKTTKKQIVENARRFISNDQMLIKTIDIDNTMVDIGNRLRKTKNDIQGEYRKPEDVRIILKNNFEGDINEYDETNNKLWQQLVSEHPMPRFAIQSNDQGDELQNDDILNSSVVSAEPLSKGADLNTYNNPSPVNLGLYIQGNQNAQMVGKADNMYHTNYTEESHMNIKGVYENQSYQGVIPSYQVEQSQSSKPAFQKVVSNRSDYILQDETETSEVSVSRRYKRRKQKGLNKDAKVDDSLLQSFESSDRPSQIPITEMPKTNQNILSAPKQNINSDTKPTVHQAEVVTSHDDKSAVHVASQPVVQKIDHEPTAQNNEKKQQSHVNQQKNDIVSDSYCGDIDYDQESHSENADLLIEKHSAPESHMVGNDDDTPNKLTSQPSGPSNVDNESQKQRQPPVKKKELPKPAPMFKDDFKPLNNSINSPVPSSNTENNSGNVIQHDLNKQGSAPIESISTQPPTDPSAGAANKQVANNTSTNNADDSKNNDIPKPVMPVPQKKGDEKEYSYYTDLYYSDGEAPQNNKDGPDQQPIHLKPLPPSTVIGLPMNSPKASSPANTLRNTPISNSQINASSPAKNAFLPPSQIKAPSKQLDDQEEIDIRQNRKPPVTNNSSVKAFQQPKLASDILQVPLKTNTGDDDNFLDEPELRVSSIIKYNDSPKKSPNNSVIQVKPLTIEDKKENNEVGNITQQNQPDASKLQQQQNDEQHPDEESYYYYVEEEDQNSKRQDQPLPEGFQPKSILVNKQRSSINNSTIDSFQEDPTPSIKTQKVQPTFISDKSNLSNSLTETGELKVHEYVPPTLGKNCDSEQFFSVDDWNR